jgi:(S)-2-hydroxyglutarate dehydrogenase
MDYDVIIAGGGILGLATAFRFLEARPKTRILLIEKESKLAAHQTGNNSGVLHSGLYYKPGSEKAKLSISGLRQMIAFCREQGVAFEQCGKIVIATDKDELPRLENLWQRGNANGLIGLRKLLPEQIREIEPYAAGIAAIHVPQEGIVDYPGVCEKLGELICAKGGEIRLNTRVLKCVSHSSRWIIKTSAGEFYSRYVITCGGLQSDRLVRAAGQRPAAKIIPFRGEYYKLKQERQYLVRNLIYPVPDPEFPFLGVHFTRLIHGGIEAGPNAVLAFAREGYRWSKINARDLAESLCFPGLWKFIAAHPSLCGYEIRRSFSRREFCHSLQKLVPAVCEDDLETGGAGVRAQAVMPDGKLVEDFQFEEQRGILHVVNAPSPAATASLAIGEKIVGRMLGQLN